MRLFYSVLALLLSGCSVDKLTGLEESSSSGIPTAVSTIFDEHCKSCHGPNGSNSGNFNTLYDLDAMLASSKNMIVAGDANSSLLWQLMVTDDASLIMPPAGKLPTADITVIEDWINNMQSDTSSAANLSLSVTSGQSSAMDITGGNSPGTAIEVKLANSGQEKSENPSGQIQIDNTTNFQILSNSCTDQISSSCTLEVRPLASANGSYSGTLTVNIDNKPTLALSGRASGFTTPSATLAISVQSGNKNAMNITGGSSPGTAVTFRVTNNGDATSENLSGATSLSNTTNFQISSNGCTSTLSAATSCDIQVQPKATTDGAYNGTLNISANNNPSTTISGTASGFTLSFAADIVPILNGTTGNQSCLLCHAGGSPSGSYALDSYAGALGNGTDGTANVLAGNLASLLYVRVNNDSMPQGAPKLSAADKNKIRDWILGGANP